MTAAGCPPTAGLLSRRQGFTGYAREKSSYVGSLDFANARYYSPYLGRFLSADTIYDGGLTQPQGLNRYSYTRNRPLVMTDPTGHNSILAALGFVLGGAAIGAGISYLGETTAQVSSEVVAYFNGQKSAQQALDSFNSIPNQASRTGAAVGGATIGGSLAAIGVASKGKTINPVTYGVVSAISGALVEPLAGGISEEHLQHGAQFDLGRAAERAVDRGFGSGSFVIGYGVMGAIAGPVGDKVGAALERTGGGRLQVIKGLGVGFEKGQLIVEVGLRSPSLKRNFVQQALIDASRKLWDWLSESVVRKVDDSLPD